MRIIERGSEYKEKLNFIEDLVKSLSETKNTNNINLSNKRTENEIYQNIVLELKGLTQLLNFKQKENEVNYFYC